MPPIISRNHALNNFRETTVLQDFRLKEKVVVITGGGSGIGLALSRAVAEVGGYVAAIGYLPEPHADFWDINSLDKIARVKYYCADVSNETALKRGFDTIKSDFGRIDGIIACAGICIEAPFLECTWEEALRLHKVNSLGTFFSIQYAVQAMLSNPETVDSPTRGSVILIGSIATARKCESQGLAAYSASKGSGKGLLAGLAVELAPLGIRVNMISPGHTVTDMSLDQFNARPELEGVMVNAVPMGRIGHRRDLKGAAIYFLSDASMYTTGSELVVSGGLHAGRL